jgi:hypothetical protein
VWVDLDDLRSTDLDFALGCYGVGPEVVLGLADHRGDGVAVAWVGDAACGDPSFHGFRIDFGRLRDLVNVQTVAQQRIS